MNNIKHFICENETVTLETFKTVYDFNNLTLHKFLSKLKNKRSFVHDDYKFTVVRETRIILVDDKKRDMTKFLAVAIPPNKSSRKFVYSDFKRLNGIRADGDLSFIVNGVSVDRRSMCSHMSTTPDSLKTRYSQIDSLKINGVNVKAVRTRVHKLFEVEKDGGKYIIETVSALRGRLTSVLEREDLKLLSRLSRDVKEIQFGTLTVRRAYEENK